MRWLTKAQARDLVEGKLEDLTAPPPFAIAHSLIRDWAYAPPQGGGAVSAAD